MSESADVKGSGDSLGGFQAIQGKMCERKDLELKGIRRVAASFPIALFIFTCSPTLSSSVLSQSVVHTISPFHASLTLYLSLSHSLSVFRSLHFPKSLPCSSDGSSLSVPLPLLLFRFLATPYFLSSFSPSLSFSRSLSSFLSHSHKLVFCRTIPKRLALMPEKWLNLRKKISLTRYFNARHLTRLAEN